MKMKRLLLAVIAIAAVLALGGCAADKKGTANNETNEQKALTIKEGVLQVGSQIGYPPMEYLDSDGVTPIGFDIEVAYAIGEILNLKVELIDTAWEGIFSSLDSNRYDCVISTVSVNEKRQAEYNLTKPYIANKVVLVTTKGAPISSPDDLAGRSAATQTETTSDQFARGLQENGLELKNYYPYDQIIQCFDDLALGRVDAVFVDSVVAAYYIGENSDKYSIVWESEDTEPIAIAMKKGNDELTQKIEAAIDSLYSNGKISELSIKYFGSDITEGVR